MISVFWDQSLLVGSELVKHLQGELSGVLEGFWGKVFHRVLGGVPVGCLAKVSDEMENGELGPSHEGDMIVGDRSLVENHLIGEA